MNQKTADQLYATLTALQATLKAAQRTMEVCSDSEHRARRRSCTKTMAAFRALSTRLDSTLANPALARTLGRADTLTGNLAAMTAQLTTTGARLDTRAARASTGPGHPRQVRHRHGLVHRHPGATQSMKKLLDELQKHPGKVPVTVKMF